MAVNECQLNGKPAFKWGKTGECFTYNPGDESSKDRARQKAVDQGIAIGDIAEEDKSFHLGMGRGGERRKKRNQRRKLKQVIFVEAE